VEKIYFDYSKLRGRIVEKGLTQGGLAKMLGISEVSLSKKLKNEIRFSADDIVRISEILEIQPEEIGTYFFTRMV
jgi:transcriptional regulator with XRE-family HTH domain